MMCVLMRVREVEDKDPVEPGGVFLAHPDYHLLVEDGHFIKPTDFTIHTALRRLGDRDPWREQMPKPQRLPAGLIEEGHAIPVARVQAMHEGKRRARAARTKDIE